MERSVFDSIGLIILLLDFFVAFFAMYNMLFNKKSKIDYDKVLFLSFVGSFAIIGTMLVLSKLLY